MKSSARVVEEGEEAGVAVRSSTSFSEREGSVGVNVSSGAARRRSEMRRRVSCVLRSVSWRADAAPTPNMIPAVVGADRRERSSGRRSLSVNVH